MIGEPPKLSPLIDGGITKPWLDWFYAVVAACRVVQSHGTTANRPTTGLYPGRFYFDESLGAAGKPIWRNKTNTGWVDGAGTAV